jgi:glycosyltransferase involved in cell wall biosynthesis
VKRVAIVHDWLATYAGSERVLEQLLALYPQADLYAVCDFLKGKDRAFLQGRTPKTSFIQKLPFARRKFRRYLPFMPLAVEQLDVSGYDLVISSSHAVAKGVLTGPDQLHVSYVHSPIRYAWDMQHQYLHESGMDRGLKGAIARVLLHRIRQWDVRTAHGVDLYLANSKFIARRIRKAYGREARVLYPPVDTVNCTLGGAKEDFYFTASRFVPYKRIDLIVEAFAQMPDRRLVVVGDGPEWSKIKGIADGHPNIELLGYQPNEIMIDHMQRAKAFIFAAEEDFGIVPVEAQACGTPVIAYGRGGALETVCGLEADVPTGLFFAEQSAGAISSAVKDFERRTFDSNECRKNALRFSPAQFRAQFAELVAMEWEAFQARCS